CSTSSRPRNALNSQLTETGSPAVVLSSGSHEREAETVPNSYAGSDGPGEVFRIQPAPVSSTEVAKTSVGRAEACKLLSECRAQPPRCMPTRVASLPQW